ncbi:hypothetical protein Lfu02_69340 [Longispora fulva]|uniref:Uncharacterized protein YjbI with pentapeptide repeats n=1 Tax=Longispora fulva TaxID=619741 RepID=A0A8J7GDL2_9ACTN|nr:pentapeptide repeat-containing protein [Longispora fulva]MBG6134527.1 uncharacterized protein YjbI with pentapeptide repeats [Longispora fulva]GIG62562.1 hypothetical protein Lfu02_69340 [Longispora fulva]
MASYWDIEVNLAGATPTDLNMNHCRLNTAWFTGVSRFGSVTFTGDAWFTQATFTGDALFDSATFTGNA